VKSDICEVKCQSVTVGSAFLGEVRLSFVREFTGREGQKNRLSNKKPLALTRGRAKVPYTAWHRVCRERLGREKKRRNKNCIRRGMTIQTGVGTCAKKALMGERGKTFRFWKIKQIVERVGDWCWGSWLILGGQKKKFQNLKHFMEALHGLKSARGE